MTTTVIFIIKLAFFSEIGLLYAGRIRSSNTTPHIELRPVDMVLQGKFNVSQVKSMMMI